MAPNGSSLQESSNNCTDVDDLMKHYYISVMYTIIFVVGLIGNITSILIYATKIRPWRSSCIIMVNLAITDLLYVCSLPFLIHYYINEDSWTMGEFMCRFVRFGFHFNLYGSILFLTCLTVFRLIVVVDPMKRAQVQRKRVGVWSCLAVWAISAAEIIPLSTMITMEGDLNKTSCLDFASNDPVETVWWYSWLLTVLGYLVPLLVVCLCNYKIVRKLAKGPHTRNPHRIRARRITVLVLVVFVVCFMPFHVLRLTRLATRLYVHSCIIERSVNAAYIISRPVAGLNVFFNLALYTLAGEQFQQAFLSIFPTSCLTKSQPHISVAMINVTRPQRTSGTSYNHS